MSNVIELRSHKRWLERHPPQGSCWVSFPDGGEYFVQESLLTDDELRRLFDSLRTPEETK